MNDTEALIARITGATVDHLLDSDDRWPSLRRVAEYAAEHPDVESGGRVTITRTTAEITVAIHSPTAEYGWHSGGSDASAPYG